MSFFIDCRSFSRILFHSSFLSGVTPTFIVLEDCHVSYEHFHGSYKARGHVADDAMCAHVKLFNIESKDLGSASCNVSKYSFSPYLTVSVYPLMNTILLVRTRYCCLFYFLILSYLSLTGKVNKGPWFF